MREIKFRAWNKALGHMSNNALEIGNIGLGEGSVVVTADVQTGHELIWMQFTGLKDKDGKEIYEDDLIQHVPDGNEPRDIYRVQWNGTDVRYQAWKKLEYFDLDIYKVEHYKIVGNFYENPELLK